MMKKVGNKTAADPKSKKKVGPVRLVWTIFMILGILGLTLVVYQAFGVGDAAFWVRDVLTLLLLMGLVFLAAAVFVWILMLVRKVRGQ